MATYCNANRSGPIWARKKLKNPTVCSLSNPSFVYFLNGADEDKTNDVTNDVQNTRIIKTLFLIELLACLTKDFYTCAPV